MNRLIGLADLPEPPPGKMGWPWTQASTAFSQKKATETIYPKVTVVTPSFQQGKYLEETIRSVLLQGYPDLEYIIIDGGSNDNSVEIIRKYAPFLTYWISEPDRGQTHAINKGFAHSTGQIMGWLNSDDILLSDALSYIVGAFTNRPFVNVTCGMSRIINPDSSFKANRIGGVPIKFVVQRTSNISQETVYWRRDVWEKLGPLDESFQFAMDYEYWNRMLAADYKFTYLVRFLGGFRLHPDSKTSQLQLVRDKEMNRIYNKYLGRDVTHAEMKKELASIRHPNWKFLKLATYLRIKEAPLQTLLIHLLLTPSITRLLSRLKLV